MRDNTLAEALNGALKGRAEPVFVFEPQVIPAASVYMMVRHWEAAFREAGLLPGDRVVVRARPGSAFIAVLLACLRQGYVCCPVRENATLVEVQPYDPRLVVWLSDTETDNAGLPLRKFIVQENTTPPTPGVALLLATSGSTGEPKLVALSPQNIYSVLQSHLPHLQLAKRSLLSVLPWHHAFGLVLELMGALLGSASMLVRVPAAGRDVAAALQLGWEYGCDTLFAVPLFMERLLAASGGAAFVAQLQGGLIGGAPVSRWLAERLRGTKLRMGYGQTEAAPGITLGQPGFFAPGYVGEPVGCEIRLKDQRLQFRGRNAAVGIFKKGGMDWLLENSWRDTGDLFTVNENGLCYLGRQDGIIKLPNGRKFNAALAESQIRRALPDIDEVLLWYNNEGYLVVLLSTYQQVLLERVDCILREILPIKFRIFYCPQEVFRRDAKGGLLRWQTWQAFVTRQHAYS